MLSLHESTHWKPRLRCLGVLNRYAEQRQVTLLLLLLKRWPACIGPEALKLGEDPSPSALLCLPAEGGVLGWTGGRPGWT